MAYKDTVLLDAPKGYFTFDNSDLTNAGSLSILNITGAPGSYVTGKVGTAASFTNTNFNKTGMSSGSFGSHTTTSLEAWIKTTADGTVLYVGNTTTFASLAVSGGYANFAINGYSLSGNTLVNDGEWHHIVGTRGGGNSTLYVDGVQDAQTYGYSTTSLPGNFYVGNNAAAGHQFVGTIDEVAMYAATLSATAVADHYTAANPVIPGGYTAQAMTASADMPGGAFTLNIPATPMTATAAAGNHVGAGNRQVLTVTEDTTVWSTSPDVVGAGATDTIVSVTATGTALVKFSDKVGNDSVVSQTLNVTLTSASAEGHVVNVYSVGGAWSEGTISYNTLPSLTFVRQVTMGPGATPTVDITGADIGYGVALRGVGSANVNFRSTEYATSSAWPYSVVLTEPEAHVSITDTPATASALMTDATVATTSDVSIAGGIFTANATMVDPTLYVEHDETVLADPMTATALAGDSGFAMPRTVNAGVALATAEFTHVTVGVTSSPNVLASPATAVARWMKPALVNDLAINENESEDPYFQRIKAKKPDIWLRLNEPAGTTGLKNRGSWYPEGAAGSAQEEQQPEGVYHAINHGVEFGLNEGPNGRGSAHFDGAGYLEQIEFGKPGTSGGLPSDDIPGKSALQFSFRTTKRNQYLMGSYESDQNQRTSYEIWLNEGRLEFRTTNVISYIGNHTHTAFTDLADGEWHTVHLYIGPVDAGSDLGGSGVYVDGKLEMHRNAYGRGLLFYGAFPDYIGGTTAASDTGYYGTPITFNVPQTFWFEGDMSEIVLMNDTQPWVTNAKSLSLDYYAFNYWTPIEAPAASATATMTSDNRGKGNQKKALYLYWSDTPEYLKDSTGFWGNRPDQYSFDPIEGFVKPSTRSYREDPFPVTDYHGFKVFARPVTNNGMGGNYYDPVTDERALINLESDVDIEEYDVIMFKDWPDEGPELDAIESSFPGQKERLVRQLRDANDKGIGLFVTNPRLAVDLGIVDRVEWVPPLTEMKFADFQGNAGGLYDYGSAAKFPWNITSSDGLSNRTYAIGIGEPMDTSPNYLAYKAYFYWDNNKNNKFRVRAAVEGLTTVPSYMIEDAVFHADFDQWGWQGVAYKYLHRLDGLRIGDEFIFDKRAIPGKIFTERNWWHYTRMFGTFATPMANVKAGTVVTTFGATHWKDNVEVPNPYKDYATTIAIEEGTMLAGRPTGGRIFVAFTELHQDTNGLPVQVLPGSEYDLANPFLLQPDELQDADDTPVFQVTGTPEQIAIVNEALDRTTFPYHMLKKRIQGFYGRNYIPVVWQQEDVIGEKESSTVGTFDWNQGRITLSVNPIAMDAAARGISFEDAAMAAFIGQTAYVVNKVYLEPYQRVNIWNVFHDSEWNVWHDNADNFVLPPDYNLASDQKIVFDASDENWKWQFRKRSVLDAFTLAFTQAYSDIPVNATKYQDQGHPTPESIGPRIRAAIETGPQAYLFDAGANTAWPYGYKEETPEQRKWEYSWTRTSLTQISAAASTSTSLVRMPDGTTQRVRTAEAAGEILISARSSQLFPVITVPHFQMGARGLFWLLDRAMQPEGSKIMHAEPVTASATMPAPVVVAQKDTAVTTEPMIAIGRMPKVAQDMSGDVEINDLPMTAHATMTNYVTIVYATPMTATAELAESFDMVHTSGEQVVMYLRGIDITLYLKEDA